jgi:hypothetical protein
MLARKLAAQLLISKSWSPPENVSKSPLPVRICLLSLLFQNIEVLDTCRRVDPPQKLWRPQLSCQSLTSLGLCPAPASTNLPGTRTCWTKSSPSPLHAKRDIDVPVHVPVLSSSRFSNSSIRYACVLPSNTTPQKIKWDHQRIDVSRRSEKHHKYLT